MVVGGLIAWIKLFRRLDRIEWGIEQVRTQSNGHITLTGSLIAALNREGGLTRPEVTALLASYTDLAKVYIIPNNPISPEEHARLNSYIERARQGGFFSAEDVLDYQAIVRKLEEEKPKDRAVWSLVALGAFLVGLFLLGQEE